MGIINNRVITDVSDTLTILFNYALDNGIGVQFMSLSPETPPAVNVNTKLIAMNSNWHNQAELPFQFAHEISHIILGQQADGILYFTPSKYGMELDANRNAIRLLLPFYMEEKEKSHVNIHDFMECFAIPYHLEDIVVEEISNY